MDVQQVHGMTPLELVNRQEKLVSVASGKTVYRLAAPVARDQPVLFHTPFFHYYRLTVFLPISHRKIQDDTPHPTRPFAAAGHSACRVRTGHAQAADT
jgi:hypothetical protein